MHVVDLSGQSHFCDIVEALEARISIDREASKVFSANPIVLGLQMNSVVAPIDIKSVGVLYNLEQLEFTRLWERDPYIFRLLSGRGVCDYSNNNIDYIKKCYGVDVSYLQTPPILLRRKWRRPLSSRVIDVCFVGARSPRRSLVWRELEQLGLNLCWLDNTFGPARDEVLCNSKIVLSVRHQSRGLLETTRVELAWACGCIVVAEISEDLHCLDIDQNLISFVSYTSIISEISRIMCEIDSNCFDSNQYHDSLEICRIASLQKVDEQLAAIASGLEGVVDHSPLIDRVVADSENISISVAVEFRKKCSDLFFISKLRSKIQENEHSIDGSSIDGLKSLMSNLVTSSHLSTDAESMYLLNLMNYCFGEGYLRTGMACIMRIIDIDQKKSINFDLQQLRSMSAIGAAVLAPMPIAIFVLKKMDIIGEMCPVVIDNVIGSFVSRNLNREAYGILARILTESCGIGSASLVSAHLHWVGSCSLDSVLDGYSFLLWCNKNGIKGYDEFIDTLSERERRFGCGAISILASALCGVGDLGSAWRAIRNASAFSICNVGHVVERAVKLVGEGFSHPLRSAPLSLLNGRCDASLSSRDAWLAILAQHIGVEFGMLCRRIERASRQKLVSILACYNERDCIRSIVRNLQSIGSEIVVIDNWSNDGSYEMLREFETKGILRVHRYPVSGPLDHYDWRGILKQKEQIALQYKGYWISHLDMDEIREGFCDSFGLMDTISLASECGYNCIDFTVLNFDYVDEGFSEFCDLLKYFKFFKVAKDAGYHRQQRLWRQGLDRVDLATSGGHVVNFPGKSVFPFKGILRHYSKRSSEQAVRKIFRERKGRFSVEEKNDGWHTHYDEIISESQIWPENWKEMHPVSLLGSDEFRMLLNGLL